MTDVVEDSNDKHMAPWSEVCQQEGLQYTPLTPYLHQVGDLYQRYCMS